MWCSTHLNPILKVQLCSIIKSSRFDSSTLSLWFLFLNKGTSIRKKLKKRLTEVTRFKFIICSANPKSLKTYALSIDSMCLRLQCNVHNSVQLKNMQVFCLVVTNDWRFFWLEVLILCEQVTEKEQNGNLNRNIYL